MKVFLILAATTLSLSSFSKETAFGINNKPKCAGMNIPTQHVFRALETVDETPTLSALLNIKAPSASEGKIIKEVFK